MNKKIAVIVWTVDPDGKKRFLLRHNKPFGDHEDEWTIVFGDIEKSEAMREASVREVKEEYGIEARPKEARNLNYKISFDGKKGSTEIYFFSLQVKNLEVKIILNEESIGYDWMKIEDAMKNIKHDDEKKAFKKI